MARTAKRYEDKKKTDEPPKITDYYVGIYSRLSVDNDDKKSESIENQIAIIQQFITDNNSDPERKINLTVYDTYIDRGVTGTSFERNDFGRLMQDVREHNVTCIIVKDLSRFGRNYLETGNLIEKILPFLGCRFIAVSDDFDSMAENVNESKLAMNIKNLVNDMYAKDISKRVSASRRIAAESGSYIGSFAPYGYKVINIQGVRQLQIDEESAQVIRKIYTLYAQGMSNKDIIWELYNSQVHRISDYQKYGHVYCSDNEELYQWSERSIWRILHNASYVGRLEQCKTQSGLCEGRKGTFDTDKKDWIIVENTHPAIVDIELFEQVQRRFADNSVCKNVEYKKKDTENIYCNILFCGNCGKPLHSTYYQSRVKDERHYAYYCREAYQIDGRKCDKNYVREEQITQFVLEQLRNILNQQRVRAKDLTMLNKLECERKIAEYMAEKQEIDKDFRYIKKQAAMMYGQYKEGAVTKAEYEAFKRNKSEQDIYAKKRLEEIERKIKKAKQCSEKENQFLRSLLKVDKCKKLNIHLVEALIEKVVVFPGGLIELSYKFSDGGI